MKKKSVVLSALSAALSVGAAGASARTEVSDQTVISQPALAPAISAEARDILFGSASKIGEQGANTFQVAKGKFKLFDNGPSFVQSKKQSLGPAVQTSPFGVRQGGAGKSKGK